MNEKLSNDEMKEDVSKPDVYCPKECRRVPVWWCIGSFMQGKEKCPHMMAINIDYKTMKARVKCNFEEEKKG